MDIYLADAQYRPVRVLDNYESVIWTDRYCAYGDFQITVPWSYGLAQNLKTLKYLTQSGSNRVMMLETVHKVRKSDKANENLVKITGRSMESFMYNRNNKTYANQTAEVRTGTPGVTANYFVSTYCVNPTGTVSDLTNWVVGTPASGTSQVLTIERGNIYDIVQGICEPNGLGFSLTREDMVWDRLNWSVYRGVDRTITDPANAIYSADQENLVNISSLESIANYKNHVLMIGAKTSIDVYAPGVLSTVSGIDRRTAVVEAKDIGPDGTTTVGQDQAALTLRGLEFLADLANRYVQAVDGEFPEGLSSNLVPELGDLVWVQDAFAIKTKVRISEKIWTSDAKGDKCLPTFEAV